MTTRSTTPSRRPEDALCPGAEPGCDDKGAQPRGQHGAPRCAGYFEGGIIAGDSRKIPQRSRWIRNASPTPEL